MVKQTEILENLSSTSGKKRGPNATGLAQTLKTLAGYEYSFFTRISSMIEIPRSSNAIARRVMSSLCLPTTSMWTFSSPVISSLTLIPPGCSWTCSIVIDLRVISSNDPYFFKSGYSVPDRARGDPYILAQLRIRVVPGVVLQEVENLSINVVQGLVTHER